MNKNITIITAVMTGLLAGTVCQAEELVIKGTQVKGTAAKSAEIISSAVKLTKSARIVKIEGAPEGLCIQSPAEAPLCGEAAELTGKTLKPGSYTTYPNIPNKKDRQSVTVHLK